MPLISVGQIHEIQKFLYKEKRPSLDEGYFDPTVYNGRKRPSERVTTMNDGRDKQWKESLSIDTCCHEGEEK